MPACADRQLFFKAAAGKTETFVINTYLDGTFGISVEGNLPFTVGIKAAPCKILAVGKSSPFRIPFQALKAAFCIALSADKLRISKARRSAYKSRRKIKDYRRPLRTCLLYTSPPVRLYPIRRPYSYLFRVKFVLPLLKACRGAIQHA